MDRVRYTIAVAPFVFAIGASVGAASDASGMNFCRQTSQAALRSCQAGARSDNWLALGKCDNVPDPAARKTCDDQAAADPKDSKHTCKEQHDLRQGVCKRLGGSPYVPVIDPANFLTSTTIDNPFFPLKPGTTFIYEGQTADGFEHCLKTEESSPLARGTSRTSSTPRTSAIC